MKKLFLILLVFLLSITTANAISSYSDGNFSFFFEDASTNITNQGNEPYNATWTTAVYNTTTVKQGSQGGYWTGSNYFHVNPAVTYSYDNFVFSAYIYMSTRTSEHRLFEHRDASTNRIRLGLKDSDRLEFRGAGPDIQWFQHGVDVPKNEWVHVLMYKNETHATVWANSTTNGVESYTTSGSYTGFTSSASQDLYYGYSAYDSGRYMDDTIVDCVFTYYGDVNTTSIEEIKSLGCPPSAGGSYTNTAPTPTINAPANKTITANQTWVLLNASATDYNSTYTLSWYVNGSKNVTNTSYLNNTYWTYNFSYGYNNYTFILEACDVDSTPLCANTSYLWTYLYDDTSTDNYSDGVPDIALNLTFDEATDPWKDYSSYNHSFSNVGYTNVTNRSVCNWYGCGYKDGSGYITTTAKFNFSSTGFAVEWWMKQEVKPDSGNRPGYFYLQTGTADGYTTGEDNNGGTTYLHNATSRVSTTWKFGNPTDTSQWYHMVIVYNLTNKSHVIYRNGALWDTDYNMNITSIAQADGKTLDIARGKYWGSGEFYLDDFIIYESLDGLSPTYWEEQYDAKRTQTPPDLDLTVTNHWIEADTTYKWDYSSANNTLNMSGLIPYRYNITNLGVINDSSNFNVNFAYKNGTLLCADRINLTAGETKTLTCNVTKIYGFMSLNITVDELNEVDETVYEGGSETNNYALVYNYFSEHPYTFPDINISWIDANTATPAYEAKDWYDSFTSEDFSSGWTADDVDPRAKKGFENAMNCYLNAYTSAECDRARRHLANWTTKFTFSEWQAATVQSTHEIHWVAGTYALMFKNLTQTEVETYGAALEETLCFSQFGRSNVRPDLDPDRPNPENGQGFGIGMAMPCLEVIGDNPSNPSSTWYPDTQEYGINTAYHWLGRLENHIASNNNDTGCPEGYLYCNYALYHTADALYFDQQTNIFGIVDTYNEDICGRAEYYIYNFLDNQTSGSAIGDEATNARFISLGDSHSHDRLGEMEMVGAGLLEAYAVFCDDQDVKDSSLTLRNTLYNTGGFQEYEYPAASLFYYPTLSVSATAASESDMQNQYGYVFEDGYDNYFLSNGFGWDCTDKKVGFYGGQKMPFGHPFAEFNLFSYVNCVPFLDIPQVANEDDVRSEWWVATWSLSNSTATGYADSTNPAPIDGQRYGTRNYSFTLADYPYILFTNTTDAGDVLYHFGNGSSFIGGLYAYDKYENTDEDPTTKILIYNDTILELGVVNRNSTGWVSHNWGNLDEYVNGSIAGQTLTLQGVVQPSEFYKIYPVYNSSLLSLEGGNTTQQASKVKTGSPNLNAYYNNWRHYNDSVDNMTAIFVHHWYTSTDGVSIASLTSGNDRGINRSGVIMLFDTGDDGTSYGGFTTDSFSLMIVNDTHVSVQNATFVNNGTVNISLPSTPFSGLLAASSSGAPSNTVPTFLSRYPANSTSFNRTWMNFSVTAQDLQNTTFSLRLFLNDTLNQTNASAQNNTAWTTNVTLGYGTHAYLFEASDGLLSANTSTFVFSLTCYPNLVNTSWSAYTNSSCLPNSTYTYSRHLVQYDANSCGGANQTFWDNGTSACTYTGGGIDIDAYNLLGANLTSVEYYLNSTYAHLTDTRIDHNRSSKTTTYSTSISPDNWYNIKTYTAGIDFATGMNISRFSIDASINSVVRNTRLRITYTNSTTVTSTTKTAGLDPSYSTIAWYDLGTNVSSILVQMYHVASGSETGYVKNAAWTDTYAPPFTLDGGDGFGTYSTKAVKTGYYNKTSTLSLTTNGTYNITGMYQTIINLTAVDAITAASINSFSANFTSGTHNSTETTLTGTISFEAMNNTNYTINVSSGAYSSLNSSTYLLTDEIAEYYQFTLYQNNSINILVYNLTNGSIINWQNTTITIISNLTGVENITSDGTFFVSFLVPNEYELRFTSQGFKPTTRYVTVTSGSTETINVYLEENTSTEIQAFIVRNTASEEIEGAIIRIQKEGILPTLWTIVDERKTDVNGKAYSYLVKDINTYYRFQVLKDGEVQTLYPSGNTWTTKQSFISGVEETVELVINTDESTLESLEDTLYGVTTTYSFLSDNVTAQYTFSDATSTIVGGRLLIYGRYQSNESEWELLSDENITDFTGNMTYEFTPINNTIYWLQAYVREEGTDRLVYEDQITYGEGILNKNLGLIYAVIIILVVLFLTVKYGPLVSGASAFAMIFVTNWFGLTTIPTSIITSIIAFIIILFARARGGDPT